MERSLLEARDLQISTSQSNYPLHEAKKRCGHRLKGWKIRVSNHELGARP